MTCKCGRSPNGKCVGWHSLSQNAYDDAVKKWKNDSKIGKPDPKR